MTSAADSLPLLTRICVIGPLGGTVGMICTSLFATTTVNAAGADGAFYGNGLLLGKTLLVLVIIVPWFFTFTWGCLWVTDMLVSLRVTDEELMEGLDVSKHGERAVSVGPYHIDAFNSSVHGGSAHGGMMKAPNNSNNGVVGEAAA
eukprot:GHRR01016456.1.p1 GENE.GHRR01016456.1~~GHRR01016456.1.p1  ORF type:complete len:146 (+),score=40.35 GHRR01016456.1:207-644(+)